MIVLVEGSGGARSATDIADRVARVAETARGGGGLQILRFKQSKKALDQLGQEDACRALVEEAFAAARQAGPVEPSRVFDEVLELGNPTLERQARWFTRQEARDDR